jgi:hypothetical protein
LIGIIRVPVQTKNNGERLKMITIDKIFRHLIIVGICCIAFVWGCVQQTKAPPGQAVVKPAEPGGIRLALKPTPGEQTSYKVVMQMRRSINWEGPIPEKEAFEESFNDEQVGMAITQRIESVDANDKTVARVTIDSLRYVSVVKNQTVLDFESSRQSDANSPLAKLTGQSYTIEIEPNNHVSSISDLSAARSLVSGSSTADRAGQNILSTEAIRERHGTLLLPQAGSEQLSPRDKWSRIKTFSFGMMGLKSYENIYTLREVKNEAGHQVAVIDMSAIPSSEVELKYRDQQGKTNFPKIFDTNEMYEGSGEVDLTAGRINSYSEHLQTNWITALPPSRGGQADANEPVVLKMTATRSYSLERIE